jgi:hypothetical protein
MINGIACFAYFNKIWGIPQTHREAYQEAATQFGVSPEHQSRLFVRPLDRHVSPRR